MNKIKKFLDKHAGMLLMLFYLVGFIGFNIPQTSRQFYMLTPVTLILSLILLFYFHTPVNIKFILIALFIAFAGFFIEVVGVHSGLLFGAYVYGDTLGIKVFDTPLMIGLNWLMLAYCTYVFSQRLGANMWLRSLLGAFLMTVYDIVLEPVAIHSGMWTWENGDVPLQNYMAWFVFSFLFHIILNLFKVRIENKIASPLFKIQFVFFLILTLVITIF